VCESPALVLSGDFLCLAVEGVVSGQFWSTVWLGFGRRESTLLSQLLLNWEKCVVEIDDEWFEIIRDGGGWE